MRVIYAVVFSFLFASLLVLTLFLGIPESLISDPVQTNEPHYNVSLQQFDEIEDIITRMLEPLLGYGCVDIDIVTPAILSDTLCIKMIIDRYIPDCIIPDIELLISQAIGIDVAIIEILLV